MNKTKLTAAGTAGAAILALSVPVIERWEGTIPATYKDPIGILTSCVGHTGPELRMGQTFTKAECRQQLDSDQRRILRGMVRCTPPVEASPETWAAFLSFSFNVGYGTYCRNFARQIATDLRGACLRMSRYVYAGGRKLKGLERRRAAEVAMCLRGLA